MPNMNVIIIRAETDRKLSKYILLIQLSVICRCVLLSIVNIETKNILNTGIKLKILFVRHQTNIDFYPQKLAIAIETWRAWVMVSSMDDGTLLCSSFWLKMEETRDEKFLSRRRSASLKAFKVKDERVATFKKVHASHYCMILQDYCILFES